MLNGQKILITGPAGRIAFGIAASLAKNNEVWGIARFSDAAQRKEVEALGVKTRSIDLANPDFSDLPQDFTHLFHLAVAYEDTDYDLALRVNAEGTGLLLAHCRKVKAALVMSAVAVHKPHPDPWYAYAEADPLGDAFHKFPTYSVSKIAQEAVARYCARQFDIPVTIARMNVAYGARGGLPSMHLKSILAGEPVVAGYDPQPYSPIHDDDIAEQIEPLVAAAAVPAMIVNWCGDDVVSVQQWTAYMGELLGMPVRISVREADGAARGGAANPAKRRALTGPCKVTWGRGFRRIVSKTAQECRT
jgi:nucleoside-diphosphate-sugar epimerase